MIIIIISSKSKTIKKKWREQITKVIIIIIRKISKGGQWIEKSIIRIFFYKIKKNRNVECNKRKPYMVMSVIYSQNKYWYSTHFKILINQ